jgi:prepilin-type N-terminal cleavage/methylation domain-containing protein
MHGRARKRRSANDGFTLLELTFAVALMAIILAIAAQALIQYHVSMDMQQQRNLAAQQCRAIMESMRAYRDTEMTVFPADILEQWPDGAAVAWQGGLGPDEQFVVGYTDPAANPLEVTITCTWRDRQDRPIQFTLTSMLTDM